MAGTSAISAIQDAIYAVLSNDGTLSALVGGKIYNDVPDPVAYPYILMSHAHEKPWHTLGGADEGLGSGVIVRIHIYSRYEGDKPALTILNRIVALLNFQPLTVTGYLTAICSYEMGRVLVEDIDKIETRHIPAEFRVLVHQ